VLESALKWPAFWFDIDCRLAKTVLWHFNLEAAMFDPDLHRKQPAGSQLVYRLVANRAVAVLSGTPAVLLGDVSDAHGAAPHLQRGLHEMAENFFAAHRKLDRTVLWQVTGYESLESGEVGTALIACPAGARPLLGRAIEEICIGLFDGIRAVESAAHGRLVQRSILAPGNVDGPAWLATSSIESIASHWSKAAKETTVRHGSTELSELNVPPPERADPVFLESHELIGVVDLIGRSDLAVRLIGTIKTTDSDDEERRTIKGSLARQDLLDAAVLALAQQSRVHAHVAIYSNGKAVVEELAEV
jgi:hypothetical protein